ncbi:alkaline shock response membrane anchor protein AmaP [Streptomyces sp. NPDC003388]
MTTVRTGRVNRVLLFLLGLLLLAGGGSVLAVGLGVRTPRRWLHAGPHDDLLSAAERTRWRDAGWWWPAVIGGLAVLVLLALWWLAANLRRRRLAEVLVDTGDGEGALLRGPALASAVTEDAGRQPGVAHAEAVLTGRRTRPAVRAGLRLEPAADPAGALSEFTAGPLTRARESAGLASLRAEVRLRAVRHRAERVS